MRDIHRIRLHVNGREHELAVEARRTLADMLRHDLGYTGTHLGCEHGICGACTVLMDGSPVRACLVFGVQADGTQVSTVEGLSAGDELSDLQQAFSDHHALQCGFCTPGFLMLAEAYLAERHLPPHRQPHADPNAWAGPEIGGPGGASQDDSDPHAGAEPAANSRRSGSRADSQPPAAHEPAANSPGGGSQKDSDPHAGAEPAANSRKSGSRADSQPPAAHEPAANSPGGGSREDSQPPAKGSGPAADEVSEAEARELIAANLCRCTGYQGIVEAVLATARSRRAARPGSTPAGTGQANAGPAGTGPTGTGPTGTASGRGAGETGLAADAGAADTSEADTGAADTGAAADTGPASGP